MTWFKVDDTLHSHKKVMRAGAEAMGLWVLAGSWSADQLTNGWVPDYAILRWAPNAQDLAERLVSAGLWTTGEHDGDDGWWFHEWNERQPTKDEVLARRKADADRRARWRESKKQSELRSVSQDVSRRDTTRESQQESRQGSALPDPTRPDPVSSYEETTTSPERKRPAAGSDINGGTVVAAWVDASKANGVEPSKAQIGQVGKTAKELLAKNDPTRVLEAARAAGAKGFASIDRELTAMAGRNLRAVPQRPVLRDPRSGIIVER